MDTPETAPVVETSEAPPVSPEPAAEPATGLSELETFRAARKAEREGAEPVEVKPEETGEPQRQPGETADTPIVVKAEPDPAKPSISADLHAEIDAVITKRVDRIGLKAREASEQEIIRLRSENETLRRGEKPDARPVAAKPPVDPNDPEPTLEQFSDQPDPYQALMAASARWHTRQENKLHDTARSRAESQVRVEAQITKAQADWDGKLDDVRKRLPDFDKAYDAVHEVLKALPNPGQQTPLVELLLTSPIGHDIAHYLGTHPEDLTRLFESPSLKAHLRSLGRLEAQVELALKPAESAPKPPEAPPAPMTPVGASATPTQYDAKTATLAQFRKQNSVRGGKPVARAG